MSPGEALRSPVALFYGASAVGLLLAARLLFAVLRLRLLDIASGPGRYLLETIHRLDAIPISAVLRDCKQENLEAAVRLRDQLGLPNVVVAHGDAFDRAALAAVTPRPTVAVVSGLYELFPDN